MHARSRGFTLVEILMVLAILGIVMIVAMPSLVKSIRGNRLRVGARTVVMVGNYARTMAILRNRDMKVTLDKATSTISAEPLYASSTAPVEPPPGNPPAGTGAAADEPVPGSASPDFNITRALDGVRIDSISIEHKKRTGDNDSNVVIYRTNGRCNPYEVRVIDEYGSTMTITVDAVAAVKVRQGDG